MAETRGHLTAARIYEANRDNGSDLGGVSVSCMFNPFEYTVTKTNNWKEAAKNDANTPHAEFEKAGPQALKLTLIFDSYEQGKDISLETVKLWKLMEPTTQRASRRGTKVEPPHVAFEWGVFKFVAVITNMSQQFTLFSKEGVPLRAKVDVTFTQYVDLKDYKHQNPTSGGGPDERIWRVVAGDRLDTIAADVYGDATQWRRIAERNRIVNPLALQPGQTLSIPLG
jgi:hypothetical protein